MVGMFHVEQFSFFYMLYMLYMVNSLTNMLIVF